MEQAQNRASNEQDSQNLHATIEHIECTLVILTNLISNFDQHSPLDRWEVMIFLLRQVSDIQFKLLMAI